jgi:hypothetical protein
LINRKNGRFELSPFQLRGFPVNRMPLARNAMYTLLCAGFVVIAGCNQPSTPVQPPAGSASAPAPAQTTAGAQQAPAYTPPTADQLYQMVAPIALFPDKLVAQVLAGSTYPDQITAADGVVDQNPNLKGASLQTAIVQQTWDPSVKGLTVFPTVLDQMAKNIDWTTSLGEAYVNDPTDVMNAIQVMRQRASSHGSLRSSSQLTVQTQTVSPVTYTGDSDGGVPVYAGPSVVPAPTQVIEIQPTNPDDVYVPEYNPQVVYGEQVAYYPGYTYEQPVGYSGGDLIAAGAIGFGAAILVGAIFDHHSDRGYGWNNWGMNWGGHGGGYGGGGYGGGGRPNVVYNNSTYVSRSTTVVNHNVTNNYNNGRTVNNVNSNNINRNVGNNRAGVAPQGAFANGRPNGTQGRPVGSTPFGPGGVHGVQGQPGQHVLAGAARPGVAGAAHAPMSMPHFNGVPQRGETSAQNERAAGRTTTNNVARSNVAGVQHSMPNTQQNRGAMNHSGAVEQQRSMQQAQHANAPQQHVHSPAVQQHAAPQRVSQPQRQVQQRQAETARPVASRPAEQQRSTAAARPAEQPRPAAAAHRQEAPRPQAQHAAGGRPAAKHDDKHDHR